ncbi:DUF2141 domain-containing protein [Novosphingobium sp. MBES04]|uniref:DUF2141 domain-containing protein n=1 Tax=Novosphingobium sp. MBES04 TaxID=1206458 RepID=UPI0007231B73|nr:hypothetical conserved protein [Novosphingobium sp. MBES04]
MGATGDEGASAPAAKVVTSALAAKGAMPHVTARITDLRSTKGQILACLTRNPDTFPDCDKDPEAHRLIVPASKDVELDFGPVAQGRYAVALIHDENANGKLDKALIIPREASASRAMRPCAWGRRLSTRPPSPPVRRIPA